MKNILIVDDNPKNIQLLANILEKHHFNIEYSQDGESAIELCKENKFNLILMDIMMPKLNGFEVCQKIRAIDLNSTSPIIFITAKADIDSVSKGFDVGGTDYITKPFNTTDLLNKVEFHISSSENNTNLKKTLFPLPDSLSEKKSSDTDSNSEINTTGKDEATKNSTKILCDKLRTNLNTINSFIDTIEHLNEANQSDNLLLGQLNKVCKQLYDISFQAHNLSKLYDDKLK